MKMGRVNVTMDDKKLPYNFDLNEIDDGLVISEERAGQKIRDVFNSSINTEKYENKVVSQRYGNNGVKSRIIDISHEQTELFDPKPRESFFPSIYLSAEDYLTYLLMTNRGYVLVRHIDPEWEKMIFGLHLITRRKKNSRKERRILRRAGKVLGVKADKVLYTLLEPRVYLVEQKRNNVKNIFDEFLNVIKTNGIPEGSFTRGL